MVTPIHDVARQWTELGHTDPMWAALTNAGKDQRWDVNDFLVTGRTEISAVLRLLERRGFALNRGTALDFGCGPGRLTSALAAEGFSRVIGVDVSATMLAKAREIVPPDVADRCEFVLNEGTDLTFVPSGSIDLVYSCRVLQHMPAPFAHGYIREFMRIAAPGAAVVFQLPSAPAPNIAGAAMRVIPSTLLNRVRRGMQMHATPPDAITRLVAECGGVTASIEEDTSAGPRWRSHLYVVRAAGDPRPSR